MHSDFGNMDFGFPCPSCGKKIAAKLSRLRKGNFLKCTHCQTSVKLSDDKFQDVRRSLENFARSLRK